MLNNIRIFFFYTDFGKIVVTDNKHDGNNYSWLLRVPLLSLSLSVCL